MSTCIAVAAVTGVVVLGAQPLGHDCSAGGTRRTRRRIVSQSRRLAAILAADIAGYSALMGADEGRTVSELKGHQAVVLPMVGEFGGRVIDTAGDGLLAEFPSVLNA